MQHVRLRTQLLVSINATLIVVVAVLAGADFWMSYRSLIKDKRVALTEEAKTVASALTTLRDYVDHDPQSYLDRTCSLMSEDSSPGHRINASVDGDDLVADSTLHAGHTVREDEPMVSGAFSLDGIDVTISERLAPIRRTAFVAGSFRIGAIIFAGVLAGTILNALLARLISRPLERMATSVRAIGRGSLGLTIHEHSNAELSALGEEISAMSLDLDRREKGRQEQLSRARRLQAYLTPADCSLDNIDICIKYRPADEIAGDLVDVRVCDNGDKLVCVADVVGHGTHAAMGAAILKALLDTHAATTCSPAWILEHINMNYHITSLADDFASMMLARISADGSRVTYASAGHEPGYIVSPDGDVLITESTGMVLGVVHNATYGEQSIEIAPGTVIVMLSDGVAEARDPTGKLFGREPIRQTLRDSVRGDAYAIAELILQRTRKHRGERPADDDETVVVIKSVGSVDGMNDPASFAEA